MSEVEAGRDGAVFRIAINRPHKRNALNPDVIAAIADGLRAAAGDPEARAILLTATGDKAFCAGADLATGTATFAYEYHRPNLPFADLLRTAHQVNLPIVGRINGACVAGGMGLLALCDMAVAADTARFGLPEVKIGMFPMQVLSVLQRLVRPRDLAEMCLTGELFDAAHAREVGLVNYVVPAAELDAKVAWLLDRVLDKSPTAIRRGKYALRAIVDMTFEQQIAFTESEVGLLVGTEDAREGVASFNERRPPRWTGR
ncbi:enoyl-CoA hydratase-related protein [Zavarzinia sp. CC-PAN008]|uniref:enoyl-CoA hydratase-related protein n=1 Tax=Zavarzinia sp. CC-PAN008 TaxID=3243332 RepID=UPI003F74460F